MSTTTHSRTHVRTPPGFTLIELLVVIVIIGVVVGISFPMLSAMRTGVGTSTSVNTIGVAVEQARLLATQGANAGAPINAKWSGVAVLVTPAHELRLVENNQQAQSAGAYLEEILPIPHNGYADISGRDYLSFSPTAGIAGIIRDGGSGAGGLKLLAPPFAIRFNENGHLVAGLLPDQFVYYDGNYDGNYDTTDRLSSYTPPDPQTLWDNSNQRYELPFEKIETVIGVVVFEKNDLAKQGFDMSSNTGDGYIKDDAAKAILETGTTLFFSRYTGAPMRDD